MIDGTALTNTEIPGTVLSIDAMGGDLGPASVVSGMAKAATENPQLRFILHGDRSALEQLVDRKRVLADRVELRHTDHVVTMNAKPSHVVRQGKGTSMWSCIEAVKTGEAQAAVSCGNTGALMGVSYARNGLDLPRPRVGLMNVGTEEHKGRAELKVAAELIERVSGPADFDFVGFVEGGDLPSAKVDVIVTDGFTGNVALKTGEGTARQIKDLLEEAFKNSAFSRIAALLALTSLRRLSQRIDPRRVNGGVFLGLNGTVVKSHGSADPTGVAAAIKLAARLATAGFNERLAARIADAEATAAAAIQTEGRIA